MEWIGEIPSHWKSLRLRTLGTVQNSSVDKHVFEDEQQVRLCNYTDVYYNEKISSTIDFNSGSCTEEESKKFLVRRGDVILTKDSETPDDIGIPSVVTEDFVDLVCGYHLSQIRPNTDIIRGGYLHRYLQSSVVKSYFETQSNGITRYGLPLRSIRDLVVLVPPPRTRNHRLVSG